MHLFSVKAWFELFLHYSNKYLGIPLDWLVLCLHYMVVLHSFVFLFEDDPQAGCVVVCGGLPPSPNRLIIQTFISICCSTLTSIPFLCLWASTIHLPAPFPQPFVCKSTLIDRSNESHQWSQYMRIWLCLWLLLLALSPLTNMKLLDQKLGLTGAFITLRLHFSGRVMDGVG